MRVLVFQVWQFHMSQFPSKPRAAAQRPSSPAAGSRSEAEERGIAQAVGGRVQRLVVPMLGRFTRIERLEVVPHSAKSR